MTRWCSLSRAGASLMLVLNPLTLADRTLRVLGSMSPYWTSMGMVGRLGLGWVRGGVQHWPVLRGLLGGGALLRQDGSD